MNSPFVALTWEIWRRGRFFTWLSIGCVSFCALFNLFLLDRLKIPVVLQNFLLGFLMTLSFLFLMGALNCTETNLTKDWNGFPYRLFLLPVRTWQLVMVPMIYGILAVELLYVAWIKLVWTHEKIQMPEWFAAVFGVYMVFYQTALWTLAGFRLFRVVVLSLGGVAGIALAALPFLAKTFGWSWLAEGRLIAGLLALAIAAFVVAWTSVGRQRNGGGRRQRWITSVLYGIGDVLPKRKKDFASPGAAQFWFEWRRTGWLLPACMAVALGMIIAPISWFGRSDPLYANYILGRLFAIPLVLAFVIGKGFVKCEFWTKNLSISPFMAARPLLAEDFVVAKLKVAALSAAITWLLVIIFLSLWLPLWANTKSLALLLLEFRMLHPNSWVAILALGFFGCLVVTWRCMVSGLWAGLSGKPIWYFGSIAVQVLVPILVLVAVGIWWDSIVVMPKNHPEVGTLELHVLAWCLALLVIAKIWIAAFSWRRVSPGRTRQYLIIWLEATVGLITLAILARPIMDVHRQECLYLLAALWLFPFARLGIAPRSLAENRHRS